MKHFKHILVWSIAAALLVTIFTHTKPVVADNQTNEIKYSTSTPQFVLLSFDGSKSLDMWEQTREFAKKMNAEGKPLHFTYFINSIYFLTEKNKDVYESPMGVKGDSRIGFSNSEEDVALRAEEVKKAYEEGNEIASHTAGHFLGGSWNEEIWKKEFNSFQSLITNAQKNNPNVSVPDLSFLNKEIVGFRAPDLSVNDAMYKTLKDFNFLYDASGVGLPDANPEKDKYGIWHLPLNTIEVGEAKTPAIAMDFSLWTMQSKDTEQVKRGTELWNQYYKDVKNAYLEYFERNYKGKRAPVIVGHHFSLWNDGVYWEAMKAFAEEVCGKPGVYCVTFKEYAEYLNIKSTEPLVKKQ